MIVFDEKEQRIQSENTFISVSFATVAPQSFTFIAQMLWMRFVWIRFVQSFWLFQRFLFKMQKKNNQRFSVVNSSILFFWKVNVFFTFFIKFIPLTHTCLKGYTRTLHFSHICAVFAHEFPDIHVRLHVPHWYSPKHRLGPWYGVFFSILQTIFLLSFCDAHTLKSTIDLLEWHVAIISFHFYVFKFGIQLTF